MDLHTVDNNPILAMGYNTRGPTAAIVIKPSSAYNNRALLGVIIPKFMLGYKFKSGDKAKEEKLKINKDKFINDPVLGDYGDDTVTIKNYITVRPYLNQNTSMPKYTIGDKIIVDAVDNDIKNLIFYPYSINRLGQRGIDLYFMAVPANPKENRKLNKSNSYYISLDSWGQKIEISTNESNGENTKQTITLDSKEGIMTFTDNKDRSIEINTNDDSIITKTSGASVELIGDVVNIKGDVINIESESEVNIKTNKFNVEADTLKSKATSVNCKYEKYKLESKDSTFKINTEKHDCMAVKYKACTYHNNTSFIGLNGHVVMPSFQIGFIPDIHVQPPSLVGSSGPRGMMMLSTDIAGVPVVKYPQLLAALTAIAIAADSPCGFGAATLALGIAAPFMFTTKFRSS